MAVNIAIVRSKDTINFPFDGIDPERELCKKINEIAKSDPRFKNFTATAVAWDQQNDWTQFTHLLLAGGLEYSDCHQKFLDWLDGLPLKVQDRVFNKPKVIKWNLDKIYLQQLQKAGISLAPSVFIAPGEKKANFDDIVAELRKQTGQVIKTIIIKNLIDAGGLTVHRIHLNDAQNGQAILDKAVNTPQGGTIVQEYQEGISTEGEWSLVFIDNKLSHGLLKSPSSSDFKVQTNFGGTSKNFKLESIPTDIVDLSKDVINKALKVIDEPNFLYARVDIIRGNDGLPKLMELELFEPELYLHNDELIINFLEALARY